MYLNESKRFLPFCSILNIGLLLLRSLFSAPGQIADLIKKNPAVELQIRNITVMSGHSSLKSMIGDATRRSIPNKTLSSTKAVAVVARVAGASQPQLLPFTIGITNAAIPGVRKARPSHRF